MPCDYELPMNGRASFVFDILHDKESNEQLLRKLTSKIEHIANLKKLEEKFLAVLIRGELFLSHKWNVIYLCLPAVPEK